MAPRCLAAVAIAAGSLHCASATLLPRAAEEGHRHCGDAELEQFALELASGPEPGRKAPQAPACVPTEGQGLWPLGAPPSSAVRAPASVVHISADVHAPQPNKSSPLVTSLHGHKQDTGTHLAHLYVVQSSADWCKAPCNGPSWELAATKPEPGGPYALLEAAIWRQDRRVTLYRFDPAWDVDTRNAYSKICNKQGWKCDAYVTHRESKALLNVGPWPESADSDPEELSRFLLDAFRQVFAKIREEMPQATNVAMTYSGHGARADGSLFQGALRQPDAVELMQEVTGVQSSAASAALLQGGAAGWGERFSFLNFGGNCAEGRWNMLATFYPFSNWIVASDLDVGGLQYTEEENTPANSKIRQELSAMQTIRHEAEAQASMEQIMEALVQAREQLWNSAWKGPIQRQDLEQAIAVYKTDAVDPFRSALRQAYLSLSNSDRAAFQQKTEEYHCDVLDSARFLDGGGAPAANASGAADPRFLQAGSLRRSLRSSSSSAEAHRQSRNSSAVATAARRGNLEQLFMNIRVYYASTRDLINWQVHASGLGFNYRGWHSPPCDLATPLGPDAPEPEGGWSTGR